VIDPSTSVNVAEAPGEGGGRLGWKTPLAALLFYGLVIAIATYPRINELGSSLPGTRVDPLNHIGVMKWYKSCLLEGKSYLVNPGLQHPTGFPLALNSPMILQAGIFLPLSVAFADDYVCYNVLWFLGFLFSGMSVFVLGWAVLRDRAAAGFAGLLGMICTPMMMRGHGHLELMFAGSMGLFLASWLGFVDRPSRRTLVLAASAYLLGALGAAYFAVLPIVPAVLYVAWRAVSEGRSQGWRGGIRWLVGRTGWFGGFVGLVVPGLLLIFSSQFYASARGLSMERPLAAFARYGTPAWSYLTPTSHHAASAASSVNAYYAAGYPEGECASYLGVVTLLLIGYAAVRRVRFPRAGYWWLALASAVVLSLGAYAELGTHRVPLPAFWLRQTVPMFKSLRAPCRFNLLAGVLAALVAAAGFRRLMVGIRRPWVRALVGSAAVALVVADLAMVPFQSDPIRRPIPGCYEWIRARNPRAAILEAPLLSSGCPHPLTETCAYWQSFHGLRSSSGYSSFINIDFDDLMVDHSPFAAGTLFNPAAFDHPESQSVGVVSDVSVRDYAWLVAKRAKFDYILLHGWDDSVGIRSPSFLKLAKALQGALVFSEPMVLVYEAARLPEPTRPVLLCDEGLRCWRGRPGPPIRVMGRSGRVTAFVPDAVAKQVFTLEARAFRRPRTITLAVGDRELARWDLGPGEFRTLESPPIALPGGLQTLTLRSDGEDAPATPDEEPCEWDTRPYGVQILKLGLKPASAP